MWRQKDLNSDFVFILDSVECCVTFSTLLNLSELQFSLLECLRIPRPRHFQLVVLFLGVPNCVSIMYPKQQK